MIAPLRAFIGAIDAESIQIERRASAVLALQVAVNVACFAERTKRVVQPAIERGCALWRDSLHEGAVLVRSLTLRPPPKRVSKILP